MPGNTITACMYTPSATCRPFRAVTQAPACLVHGGRPERRFCRTCSTTFLKRDTWQNLSPDRGTHLAAFPGNIAFPDISPDVLIAPFQFSNVAISVLWAPIIVAPRWKVTESIAKSRWSIIIPSMAFLYFFLAATVIDSPDLADVFKKSIFLFTDGAADPKNMAKLLSSPSYAAQDWIHVLIWDYGAGRLIYLDALKKGVPIRPALLVTFIAGPVGLLVHELTCAIAKPKESV